MPASPVQILALVQQLQGGPPPHQLVQGASWSGAALPTSHWVVFQLGEPYLTTTCTCTFTEGDKKTEDHRSNVMAEGREAEGPSRIRPWDRDESCTSPPPAKKPHSTLLATLCTCMLGTNRVVINSGRWDYSELQCLLISDEDNLGPEAAEGEQKLEFADDMKSRRVVHQFEIRLFGNNFAVSRSERPPCVEGKDVMQPLSEDAILTRGGEPKPRVFAKRVPCAQKSDSGDEDIPPDYELPRVFLY